jgi:hypothetical protein
MPLVQPSRTTKVLLDGDPTMGSPPELAWWGDEANEIVRSPSDEADLEPPCLSLPKKRSKAPDETIVPLSAAKEMGQSAVVCTPPPSPPPPRVTPPLASPPRQPNVPSSQVVPPPPSPPPLSASESPADWHAPLRHKRADKKQRRALAMKILQQRRLTAPAHKGGSHQASEEQDEESSSSSPGPSKGVATPTTPCNSQTSGWEAKHASVDDPETPGKTEHEIHTVTPESTEDTVSWASTLTTDPSRHVTSLDKSRQIPYLRLDAALPSVQETEEPPSKLDRHFLQQNPGGAKAHPSSYHPPSPIDPTIAPPDSPLRAVVTPPFHPYGDTVVDVATNPVATTPVQDEEMDQRDGPPVIRRTRSGTWHEQHHADDLPQGVGAAPDRSVAARSDPGNRGVSTLAAAAARWPHLRDRYTPSPHVRMNNLGNTTEDVLIHLHPGGETFEHSSHILAYASPVLRQHLKPVAGGWYRLDLNATLVEWQLIVPFLEPHSVQSAVVTPGNISHLLPWFVQLGLDVLVAECDNLLVTLEFPKAFSTEGVSAAISAAADQRLANHASIPQVNDMVDILLLVEISSLAGLQGTRAASLETLESYLSLHPGLATDAESLPILMRILQDHPSVRQRLWRKALIRFLPADLPVFSSGEAELSVVEGLVENPLFPFLLREGLSRAAREDTQNRRTLELEERWKRFRQRQQGPSSSQDDQWNDSNIQENSILEFPPDGSVSLGHSDRESVNTGTVMKKKSYLLDVCLDHQTSEFAAWWLKSSEEFQDTRYTGQSKSSLQHSLATIRGRAKSQKLQSEMDEIRKSSRSRTTWLETVLERLRRVPIFLSEQGEGPPGIFLPGASLRDHRKFLC